MELTPHDITIQEQIAAILADIARQGYSTAQPLDVGEVEQRMMDYATANGIMLGSNRLYMTAKQLQHCMRPSKEAKGLVVAQEALVSFPSARYQMELYFDGVSFIYTDLQSKFIIHPNYKIKIRGGSLETVNFITATRVKDPPEFTLPKYKKVKTD